MSAVWIVPLNSPGSTCFCILLLSLIPNVDQPTRPERIELQVVVSRLLPRHSPLKRVLNHTTAFVVSRGTTICTQETKDARMVLAIALQSQDVAP
jgi:hypothetical protein